MKSMIQSEKRCYICGGTACLEDHHIFFGSNRANSEKYGLKVWLCCVHHRGKYSPHLNRTIDLQLREIAQREFEKTHSHEEFMDIFGRNYLDVQPQALHSNPQSLPVLICHEPY